MINQVPAYLSLAFGLTTIATVLLFYYTIKNSSEEATRKKANAVLAGLVAWLGLQAALTLLQVYTAAPHAMPPRMVLLGVMPTLLLIIATFATQSGRRFIDSLPLQKLTFLHVVRIPVELVLWGLFIYKAVPQLMTFEGRNFDILAGVTAPLAAYVVSRKTRTTKGLLLFWNLCCLGLLMNIVVNALLAAPSPLQKLAFDQPNIAILHFPFSWLPVCVVPIVLFAHLAAIRQLVRGEKSSRLDNTFFK